MSRSQADPSLGTSGIDNRPATLGAHTHQEAVAPGTASLGWLISPLHFDRSEIECRKKPAITLIYLAIVNAKSARSACG
jgi:hypothetical protein